MIMTRMVRSIFLLTIILLLPGVVFAQSTGLYDGIWQGSGTSADGTFFRISLTIKNDSIEQLLFQFVGPEGLSCLTTIYGSSTREPRPRLHGNRLNINYTDTVLVAASFEQKSASGHFTLHAHDRTTRCNGEYEFDWIALRQAFVSAATTTPAPKSVNPHPFQTLIQILIFGLANGSILALNAIGVTLIYSTVRTLNLAHGDVFALTTVIVTSTINGLGMTLLWSRSQIAITLILIFIVSVGMAALLSVGVGEFGFKPFRGRSQLAPIIATLGLSFILYQGALVWRTFQHSWIPGEHRSVPGLPEVPTDGIPNFLPSINLTDALGLNSSIIIHFADIFVFVMALVFVLLATWFLQKTRTGRAIRALSQNEQAAQIVGVDVNRTIMYAFAVGGAFAGAAAFIFALYYGRPFGAHGAQSGLLAFAAALLGGIGSPIGALISGLTLGFVASLSDYYLNAGWTSSLLLLLLIMLLVWRPMGLTSHDESESLSVRDSVILTKATSSTKTNRWFIPVILLFAFAPPIMDAFNISGQTIMRTMGIFMLLALGLNVSLGLAGLLDFGFAASFGLGAYTAALLLLRHTDLSLIILVSILLGTVMGLIKGVFAWRLRGDFFSLTTLAFGLLFQQVVNNLPAFTGGASGIGQYIVPHFLIIALTGTSLKYYLVFAFVLLATVLATRLNNSRTGRAWIASSEDEGASKATGINVIRYRVLALILSSILATLAGVLFASTFSYVDPETTLSFHISSLILTMVILGGAGDVSGVLFGAAMIILYDKVIVGQLADLIAIIWPSGLVVGSAPDIRGASFFNFGIALYLTVLFRARNRKNYSPR